VAKISRPVLYTGVVGVIALAWLWASEPDDVSKKGKKTLTKTDSRVGGGITEEDLKAQYARYTGKQRDGFFPKVIPAKSTLGDAPRGNVIGNLDNWNLTGVSVVNNIRSATLENTTTKEIQFVKSGDLWNGLRVITVSEDHIILRNAKEQQTRLTFVEPTPDKGVAVGIPPAPVNLVSAIPNAQNQTTLPPLAPRANSPQNTRERGTNQP
jgi:hypothetical protein